MIPTPEIDKSSWCGSGTLLQSCCFVTMACPGSFPSCHGEESGQDLAPDKLGCTTSCQRGETDPNVLSTFFCIFVPRPPTFLIDPTVIESVVGSSPLEHPH